MSSNKSKSRDEARYDSKRQRKPEIREKSKKDYFEDSLEYRNKEKRDKGDKKNERKNYEDDDYTPEFNRKKREEKYNLIKNISSESDDPAENRRKSSKKYDKNERIDKENDFYNRNYDEEKVKYGKEDERLSQDEDDINKEIKRKQKKNSERDKRTHSDDNFDEKNDRKRKRDNEKVSVVPNDHSSKHSKHNKREKQRGSYKKQYHEQYSSDDENDTYKKNIHSNQIRSSVHKIEYKLRNEERTNTINKDNCYDDSRTDLSKQYETEKNKKKDYKKSSWEGYSSDSLDERTDQHRSDRIRSSVQKVENEHRNDKIIKAKEDEIDYSNLRRDSSKYKSKHSENEKDRSYEEYNNKRKRDSQFENKSSDDMTERNSEKQRDRLEPQVPSDPTDAIADSAEPLSKRQKIANINMRTGGAYIPPARLRMMQESIKDKGGEEYQRIAWEALKKSIVGMTNKVNSSNITEIVPELFKENIIRGRGVLARAIMQAQAASPTFTRVYAALVAIINTKFPEIGELILKRLIMQYKRGFRRNDKTICMTAARFVAHLLNQEVAHEVLILEMVTHLLENPTEDSVEIAIATLKECGKKLTQLTPRGMRAITQRVRDVLHEASIDMRVRYMIEVFFAVQKDNFKDFEVISPELDLVEEDDKYTHLINLDDAVDAQDMLNVFKFDPNYLENEEKYKSVANEILGDSSDESGNESDDESEEDGEKEENEDGSDQKIIDMTETNLVCLRRKIYLTIQSSLDFEECAHKLLKLELKPGQILEMCYMILDCCAQQRTYEKFYGLLAQRFCQLNKIYVEPFTEIFDNSYKTIHRLETNKLRNVAKFFAHLLYTDAISWNVLNIIKLNEDDTTSSSRIFIKILFQELCEYMGLPKLNERVKDVTLQEAFEGLFPRDHPHNTRFAINFFTSIGLGGLTDELREHLKVLPKNPAPLVPEVIEVSADSSSGSSSSSSSSSSSTTSSSSSSSSESDSDSQKNDSSKKRKTAPKRKK